MRVLIGWSKKGSVVPESDGLINWLKVDKKIERINSGALVKTGHEFNFRVSVVCMRSELIYLNNFFEHVLE